MPSFSACVAIATTMRDVDRDALLGRVDAYIASGMNPVDAQRTAATDIAAELDAEHADLLRLAGEQHPKQAPEPAAGLDALAADVGDSMGNPTARRQALLRYIEAFVEAKRTTDPVRGYESSYFGGASPDTDRGVARYAERFRDELPAPVADALALETVRDYETGESINAADEIRGGHIAQLRRLNDEADDPAQEPIQFAPDDDPGVRRRRQDSTRATVAAGRIRRSIAEMADMAASQEVWKNWYELHESALVEHFGQDAELFKRLLSITSQSATVASNFMLALKAYRQWYAGEPFKGYLPAVALNLSRLRKGQDIQGPKITQYGQAVLGYEGGIAVDRHIAMLMFNTKVPNKSQILAARDRITAVAERLGWTPREVQSALWALNQQRLGKDPSEVESYATLIEAKRRRIKSAVWLAEDARRAAEGARAGESAAGGGAGFGGGQADLFGRPGELRGRSRRPAGQPADDVAPLSRDEPYAGAPDSLMGYRKNGPQAAFGEQGYRHVEYVRVTWEDGTSMAEAMTGLNRAHALERARRNWPTGTVERITREDAEAEDPGIGAAVAAAMAGNAGGNTDPTDLVAYAVPPGGFTLRDFGRWGKFIEAIQDRYNRWKQVIEDVRRQGGTVNEANDFYAAEERYWGRVGSRIEDFRAEVKAWVEALTKDGLTLQDVSLYAYAQHAPERNAYIASIRPGMPDGGSGMTNATAAAILQQAQLAGLDAKLQTHAATLREWIQGTRDIAHDDGLIDDTEYLTLSGMFSDYVPLRGLDKFEQRAGTGSGFDVKGAFTKAAKGRYSEAKNIIEQVVQDRVRTLIRSGKNEVLRTFAQFALDNPDPSLWEFSKTERKPVFVVDANGNRYIEEKDTLITDDRTVALKDGGDDIYITIKDKRLLEQMRNLHVEQVGRLIGAGLFANRILGRLYTSLSPVFTVINAARDVQAATVGIIDTVGFLGVPKLYAKLPGALKQAWAAEAGKPSAAYQIYRATGGKTGFFDFKTIDEQAQELADIAKAADGFSVREVLRKTMAVIEGVNGGIENATRFAAFEVARESGKTVAEAASISKNITVNFNRKGAMTPGLSAWFLFFNPAVQGTARVVQSLKNPKVLATLGTAMVGIMALALRNAAMGDDDDDVAWWDKIPGEVKERNVVIVLPPGSTAGESIEGAKEGRYIKIPMPYGYNFFAVVANQIADVYRNLQDPRRGRDVQAAAMQSFKAFAGAWIPTPELGRSFDTPKSLALAATPDALNPVMQNVLNLNAFGRPLRPDDERTQTMPASARYFAGQAGTIFQRAAQNLNELGGGNQFMTGNTLFDLAPSSLENLARGYGGGLASFGLDLLNAIYMRQTIERPSVESRRLPFLKQLYGVIDDETDRMVSSERMDAVKAKAEPMKRAADAGDAEAFEAMAAKWGTEMYAMGSAIEVFRDQLSLLRKAELEVISSDAPNPVKYAQLVDLNKRRRGVLQQFNRVYDEVVNSKVSAAQPSK